MPSRLSQRPVSAKLANDSPTTPPWSSRQPPQGDLQVGEPGQLSVARRELLAHRTDQRRAHLVDGHVDERLLQVGGDRFRQVRGVTPNIASRHRSLRHSCPVSTQFAGGDASSPVACAEAMEPAGIEPVAHRLRRLPQQPRGLVGRERAVSVARRVLLRSLSPGHSATLGGHTDQKRRYAATTSGRSQIRVRPGVRPPVPRCGSGAGGSLS